jgi:uncharacterized SAM-binding protein YcdF (DUF218 family)
VPAPGSADDDRRGTELRELAAERGWRSVAAVTSTYQGPRARLQLSRCFDGELTVVTAQPRRGWWRLFGLAAREQLGYLDALVRSRAC